MIFRCNCSICKKYGNTTSTIYWRKINKLKYNEQINWIKSSWIASRGFINSEMIYMKYMWGGIYKREFNNTINAVNIPVIFILVCEFCNFIESCYNKVIKYIYI